MEEVIPQKKRSNDSANCCDPPKILPPHLTGGITCCQKSDRGEIKLNRKVRGIQCGSNH